VTRALPELSLATQLIGVDGGASGVRAFEIEQTLRDGERVLAARGAPSARDWPATPGFLTPAQRGVASAAELGPRDARESDQAWKRVETTARCVLEIARARGAARVLVGVAMPGLKTADVRGIAFARHGPRCEEFLDALEVLLRSEGLEFAAPIRRLESDGACAGVGEEFAADGALRGAECAYYLGGGTGLAEALKLRDELVALEHLEDWLPRAWRLREPLENRSYDDVLSARGINESFRAQRAGEQRFPEELVEHEPAVQGHFAFVGRCLATLVVERVVTLRARGPQEQEWPGPHQLSRVVVGLRLGQLLADERTRPWFEREYCEHAASLLRARGLDGVHWSTRISTLSAAPAIGAAALALYEAETLG
jgi:hypothetical protein